MAKERGNISDPFGNHVYLLPGLCAHDSKEDEVGMYDDATTVISKPAMVIEIKSEKELHYFRSIGWHRTMLVMARKATDGWEAYRCITNPSNEEISALLKKGKQII
ncbi:MAG TPA: hypothetical protein VM012_06820 [Flavitalea sp.]|nr:hypothetical protein [Flavitalea sp.]